MDVKTFVPCRNEKSSLQKDVQKGPTVSKVCQSSKTGNIKMIAGCKNLYKNRMAQKVGCVKNGKNDAKTIEK